VMRARKTGDFIIPPAEVKVKRDTYKTNTVAVNVSGTDVNGSQPGNVNNVSSAGSGSASQDVSDESPLFLRILPSKRDVYVGEQFVSELKVYTSVNTRPTAATKEVPYEGFYKQMLDPDQTSTRENINGKPYITQVIQRHVLIPQKAGKIVIEPFDSEWTLPQRVSGSTGSAFDDFFNDPFFDRVRDVPTMISTLPVTINVKRLPEGAPSGFTGAVGDFKVGVSLSSDHAVVNDAISLKIKISGTGNLSLIGAPKVDFPPDHDVYETTKSLNINTSGNRITGNVSFEYPVVVRHAGSFRIAPVSFSWFDPVEKKYKTYTSDEFTFTVEKGEGIEEGGQVYIPGNRGEVVEDIGTDILDIDRQVPEFRNLGQSPLGGLHYWVFYILAVAVFITFMILLPLYYRRRADVRLTRNRKANKLARSRMKVADKARKMNEPEKFYEETEKAIWGYLSDKLSIEYSTLSRDKVAELLKEAGLSDTIFTELVRIMDECEFSRYAPSSEKSDMTQLYNDSLRLIHSLEQNIILK